MATVSIYETMSLEQMQHDMYFVWKKGKTQPVVLWDSQCHRLAGLPRLISVSVRSGYNDVYKSKDFDGITDILSL